MKSLKSILADMYISAEEDNMKNIISLHNKYKPSPWYFLDTGCWDGLNTQKYGVSAVHIHGTDLSQSPSLQMPELNFMIWDSNSDKAWYADNFFDLIISNQVIEHLTEIDNYMAEVSRILRKWWIFIVSSNNLSSWHNIVALVMGWTPFDLQNFCIW